MKKYLLLLLLFPSLISAQDFTMVDNVTRSAYKNEKSVISLAERIDYDFKTDVEKVRAVYTWITYNITYRKEYSRFLKEPEFLVYFSEEHLKYIQKQKEEKKIANTFNKRAGVCEGFSLLFKKLCDLLKIENELVLGYTKPSVDYVGILATRKNHVWNAVKVQDKWIMIDATFGAGVISNGLWLRKFNPNYFDVSLNLLNRTHFPSAIKWRNFQKQKTLKDFCNDPMMRDAFFKHRIKIEEPKKGVITLKKKGDIKFKIKGVKNKQSISYAFTNEGIFRKPKVKVKKGYSDYYLQRPRQDTALHIYIDNELALEYKVKLD
ncbi:transglutaminase domain-containing protein [Tenacibaculum jejuense]|uniref:Putative Transglutaminase n=1 Tax=Tenacibaculum jejuense TaxID=584609 RepID=A0A238UE77_9FLAO|nr:transglutaminase domain-containing protein [Tenacibaculum jejuense]SNR16710.1 putative Transglutaminase [Tenacibaculum jejuense]